ncbi:MAG: transglycosylase SLT domain-containing protein [Hydrogenophaga sp.]|uniref:transglycosylase SLT domain-containing protein n=1 Tax=Hydrogenophaga sp. TaxID=1904254 RepID=UPI003D0CAD58
MTANNASPHQSTSGAVASLRTALRDTYQGFFDITHNGLALLGTLLAVALITLSARADLRQSAEQQLLGWLLERQEALAEDSVYAAEPSAVDRVTAALPAALPKEQANVAFWLSRKYRVAAEPLGALVAEAYEIGAKANLDPTLILAVMAIESRFNPFAQSPVGAQGLMQVLTRVHTEKYEDFGGHLAAFDPMSNLRVGVRVLQDCIKRAGSVEGGLRLYVGAVSTDGSWYINKVMAEHLRILSVAKGKPVPRFVPQARPIPVVAPAAPPVVTLPAKPGTELEAEGPAQPPMPTGSLTRS